MNGFVIFGHYGRGNLGDETNLRELVGLVKKSNQWSDITVISASPAETASSLKVETVGKFDFLEMIAVFRENDLLIGGGGSLFQDCTSLRSLLYYSFIIFLAKFCKMKIFLYGQGIGPIRSRVGKLIAGWALSKVDLITVRDRLSIIALAELNVRKPEIHFTAEPLLALDNPGSTAVNAYWSKQSPVGKRLKIGLVIQDLPFIKRVFWEEWLDCLNWDSQVELFLIPMQQSDLKFIQKFSTSYDIAILPTERKWENLLAAIGGLDLVVSSRLHGLVAAAISGTPCYGLAGDPKVEGFCLQLGVPFTVLTAETEWLSLCNKIIGLLRQPREEQLQWQAQLPFWKARARENSIILKQFLTADYD